MFSVGCHLFNTCTCISHTVKRFRENSAYTQASVLDSLGVCLMVLLKSLKAQSRRLWSQIIIPYLDESRLDKLHSPHAHAEIIHSFIHYH